MHETAWNCEAQFGSGENFYANPGDGGHWNAGSGSGVGTRYTDCSGDGDGYDELVRYDYSEIMNPSLRRKG